VDRKLTLKVTAGNLRQSHLYIRGHLDFFPADAIGPPRRNCDRSHEFEVILDGLDRTIQTDIPPRRQDRQTPQLPARAPVDWPILSASQPRSGGIV